MFVGCKERKQICQFFCGSGCFVVGVSDSSLLRYSLTTAFLLLLFMPPSCSSSWWTWRKQMKTLWLCSSHCYLDAGLHAADVWPQLRSFSLRWSMLEDDLEVFLQLLFSGSDTEEWAWPLLAGRGNSKKWNPEDEWKGFWIRMGSVPPCEFSLHLNTRGSGASVCCFLHLLTDLCESLHVALQRGL